MLLALALVRALEARLRPVARELTVARVDGTSFAISAIPHTVAVTVLADRKVGDRVNLETDIIGKYVEKLLQPAPEAAPQPAGGGITREFLTRYGF